MATIDNLLEQIEDLSLRNRLLAEISAMKSHKKFGLVFEEHLPETIEMPTLKVKKGCAVRHKNSSDIWTVKKVSAESAWISLGETEEKVLKSELVVVKKFGEPVYPCLKQVDSVIKKDSKATHILIESDNYHALQLLQYTHEGKVDLIYIDPPYNTGARDWKYNNDYVDANDTWRHSKWLSFMKKRLEIAKKLLDPKDSALVIAIDDHELANLYLLLNEPSLFAKQEKQIINITINPKGKPREGRFSQVDEYLIVVYIGESKTVELMESSTEHEVRWPYLRRSEISSKRESRPRQFYPIFVDQATKKIVSVGEPLSSGVNRNTVKAPAGCSAVFPIKDDGTEMNWGLTAPTLRSAIDAGFVRVTNSGSPYQDFNFCYLTVPSIQKVKDGVYKINA